MSSTMPSDAIPILESQKDSLADENMADNGKIDRDEKNDHALGPDVIDLDSSQSVDRSIQLKVNELSHLDTVPENSTTNEAIKDPDLAALKIDEPSPPIETTSLPVNPTTSIEKASEPVPVASAPASPLPSPRRIMNMPTLVNLSDLKLHSPSTQIIGTPFATNTTRFEYPFPDTPSSSNPASGPSSPPLSSSALTFATASGGSFTAISTSQPTSQMSPPSLSYPMSFSDMPSYNPTHPKLKTQPNPPIPPSLQKKRTRWTLNLLGRRKSSFGSDDSAGTASSVDSALAGTSSLLASPPGSPREEPGKH